MRLTLVYYLIDHPGCTLQEIDQAMCEVYPGLFTPHLEFIHLCLESYATQIHMIDIDGIFVQKMT